MLLYHSRRPFSKIAAYKSARSCSICHRLLYSGPAAFTSDRYPLRCGTLLMKLHMPSTHIAPYKNCLLTLHWLDSCRTPTECHSLLLPLHTLTTAFQRPRCLIALRTCKRGAHAHQQLVHLLRQVLGECAALLACGQLGFGILYSL